MDFDKLVEEIVARVSARLAAVEEPVICAPECKPKLLILTAEHNTTCHDMLDSKRLSAYYDMECALMSEYQCNIADYEAVILFDLTIEAMTRLAGGVCDTPFTALAQKAILLGKKIFVPQEAVELLGYAETIPKAYYEMLQSKLDLLKASGMMVCAAGSLEDVILTGEAKPEEPAAPAAPAAPVVSAPTPATTPAPVCCAAPIPTPIPPTAGKEAEITKRIVTERDLAAACDREVSVVHVKERAIVTDLARDYAGTRGITICKDL